MGDFRLLQDDSPVPIAVFTTSEEPIRIALLLDSSKSTVTVLDKIKKAAKSLLRQLRPQDQAMVVSFDSEIQVLCPPSPDRAELESGIDKVRVGGIVGTRMRDAISQIMQGWFHSVRGRMAIVLLSDGQDYGSHITDSDLVNAVSTSNTVIYSVFYSVDPREVMKKLFGVSSRLPPGKPGDSRGPYGEWSRRETEAAAFMQQLSDLSAGRFYRSEMPNLKEIFERIAEELRHQYQLGFYPEKAKLDGEVHLLRVEVSGPGLTVRARRSYRATK